MKVKEKSKRASEAAKRNGPFRVRDYPFFFMHWIITKNNQNIGEAVRELGITPQIWRILALLQERDGVSISELAEASLIDRTLLSRILNDLEERGFVRKKVNPKDKRYTGIYLAPAGAKMFATVLPAAQRQIERAISGLSSNDLAELKRMLTAITRNLSRSPHL
jgi:MarR family transcriptional regulator, organic hydroperoxide resistance regulator